MSTYVERVINGVEKGKIQSRTGLKSAPSLRPGLQMMDGCLVKNPMAEAIRDAWRFSANRATRLVQVSREAYALMIERQGTVTFG
jgi:hypothetical protein